jgi:hypothetical protein
MSCLSERLLADGDLGCTYEHVLFLGIDALRSSRLRPAAVLRMTLLLLGLACI